MTGVKDKYESLAISEGKIQPEKLWDYNIKMCPKATA
jgi:hypothetical protein